MKKTYHIITIGCQMNISDSERIAAYLESYGFKSEPNRVKAGLVILNTCGIRQKAEDRNYGLIPEIREKNPLVKIILTGCLAERKDVRRRLDKVVDIFLPIKNLPELYRELGLVKKINKTNDYLEINPKVNSKFSVFIPIGNGCDNFCSYCVVPYARGREIYRSASDIIAEAQKFIKQGFKEIILIAQNVNSYKIKAAKADLKFFPNKKAGEEINFPELLVAAAKLTGDFWLRFFTSHPKNMSAELIAAMKNNRQICRQIHLPAQSGDDRILAAMNRKYTVKHYLSLVKALRKAIPEIGLSSDLIVGFPGETKKQFAKTEKLMRQAEYDMVYLARFSSRPGTAAAKLKDNVSAAEKQRREEALNKILSQTAWKNNQRYLNKAIKVLVQEKNKRGEWLGKNEQFVTVKILGSAKENLQGKFVRVKITEVRDFGLTGVHLSS
ncbi:MAG: tRNA (N6-isopentenyl adenosine(37)-C2)-methylthiotransferase MiaB [Patescibacteria group bacterium]|nr:tRNA (N6-isopentenyl adenosine(37)-C2)-methylthiotransferase MiaB [Patescibacteria group bacterium]